MIAPLPTPCAVCAREIALLDLRHAVQVDVTSNGETMLAHGSCAPKYRRRMGAGPGEDIAELARRLRKGRRG